MKQPLFENIRLKCWILLTLLTFFVYMSNVALAQAEDPICLSVSNQLVDGFFDLPSFDAHQIPKTNVVLSKTVKTPGALEMEKNLGIDVNGITQKVLEEQLGGKDAAGRFTLSQKSEGNLLVISPWVYLNLLDDGRAVPWMVWTVEYWDLYWSKKKWQGSCVACLSEPKPLDGTGGWASKGGKALQKTVKTCALKLLGMAETDLLGGYKKKQFQKNTVDTVW